MVGRESLLRYTNRPYERPRGFIVEQLPDRGHGSCYVLRPVRGTPSLEKLTPGLVKQFVNAFRRVRPGKQITVTLPPPKPPAQWRVVETDGRADRDTLKF
jgi:hypothetical protein